MRNSTQNREMLTADQLKTLIKEQGDLKNKLELFSADLSCMTLFPHILALLEQDPYEHGALSPIARIQEIYSKFLEYSLDDLNKEFTGIQKHATQLLENLGG